MQHFIQVPRLSPSLALFLSPGNEVGRLFKLPAQKVNPKFSFDNFIFLQIGLTVEINLTVKKLFKIAVRKTSRTAELAVCKSRIYNFILSAKKYEKKGPINKDT